MHINELCADICGFILQYLGNDRQDALVHLVILQFTCRRLNRFAKERLKNLESTFMKYCIGYEFISYCMSRRLYQIN